MGEGKGETDEGSQSPRCNGAPCQAVLACDEHLSSSVTVNVGGVFADLISSVFEMINKSVENNCQKFK